MKDEERRGRKREREEDRQREKEERNRVCVRVQSGCIDIDFFHPDALKAYISLCNT